MIDTNIARSAGDESAQSAVSVGCRDFLLAVRDKTKHKMVSTEAIDAEWQKHQSRFTTRWLVSMYKRRRVCAVDAPLHKNLRQKIESIVSDERTHKALFGDVSHTQAVEQAEKMRLAMLKDAHLIEAALRSERIVCSLDDTMRNYFHLCTSLIGLLKRIVWVNPCNEKEQVVLWLCEGAELDEKRRLGYVE